MNVKASLQNGFVRISDLILLVIAIAFFPRVLTAIGVPPIINFLHFPFVLGLFSLMLTKIQNYFISKQILLSIISLLGVICASALVNNAGIINVILDFLLLAEPFLLLLVIVGTKMSLASVKRLQSGLMGFTFIHIIFVYYQFFIIRSPDPDDVQGIFVGQGAGHHVGGAVALTAAIYFFVIYRETFSLWLRTLVAIVVAADIVFSDSKQVIVAFLVSLVFLLITKLKSIKEALQYFSLTTIAVIFVYKAAEVFFSSSLSFWGKDNRSVNGLIVKFSVFSIINSYYQSFLNLLLGLGPGHTIGRLGWLIPDYKEYLQPLGVTSSPVTEAIFAVNDTNPLSNKFTGSSMFSLTFSWAGVWGDLGILGLGIYIYLWYLVWRICSDDLSKFFLITILVQGCIFSWMEEPGYMLFMISLIGFQAQKSYNNELTNRLQIQENQAAFQQIEKAENHKHLRTTRSSKPWIN
jgi:hypothetical protein